MPDPNITKDYPTSKVVATCILSFLAALTMLVIFIVFISAKKPASKDLGTYTFVTFCIDFILLIIYGVCGMIKDSSSFVYGMKVFGCATVVFITIFVLNTIALVKNHSRTLPVICLCLAIAVSAICFFVTLGYMLYDSRRSNELKPVMDDDIGMGYILASGIENKDNEITLKNEAPKSEYSFKNGENPSESTLRNEAPKSEKNPRRNVEPEPRMRVEPSMKREAVPMPVPAPIPTPLREENKDKPSKTDKPEDHVKTGEDGKLVWEKTHFILAIESGAEIKSKWAMVTRGIRNWLDSFTNSNVLFSMFTFDDTVHNVSLYKTPKELTDIIFKGIEVSGGDTVVLDSAMKNFGEVIKDDAGKSRDLKDWLHYPIVLTTAGEQYPEEGVNSLLAFKERSKIQFHFTVISQMEKNDHLTKLATALEGGHYAVKVGSVLSRVFTEAFIRNPFRR